MRVCSLLPSSTEIVCALGMGHLLVGVSHECDFPPEVVALPKLTWSNIRAGLSAAEIDRAVGSALGGGSGLYGLHIAQLEKLAPTVILTQRLCDVCAVADQQLQRALEALHCRPEVIYLEPHSLEDILADIHRVAGALLCRARGEQLVANLRSRIETIRTRAKGVVRPRVFCMEWVDPPYGGGHWMHDLVEIAGAEDRLALRHRPSARVDWRNVIAYAPEVIVVSCCGFDLARGAREAGLLAQMPGIWDMPAVRTGRVFATDGSSYFSRPGPRIVDSLEILAHLIHPRLFQSPETTRGWTKVALARAAT